MIDSACQNAIALTLLASEKEKSMISSDFAKKYWKNWLDL